MILNTQNKEIKKVMVGHEKDAYLDKKKKMIIKITQDVNPREGIKKNYGLSKNVIFLLGSTCIIY